MSELSVEDLADDTEPGPSDESVAVTSPDLAVEQIVAHLQAAITLATSINRGDWVRKLEMLARTIRGRERSVRMQSAHALAPVGPPIDIRQWIEETISSLTSFREVYMLAHAEDPVNWPTERPENEWFEQWGSHTPPVRVTPMSGSSEE